MPGPTFTPTFTWNQTDYSTSVNADRDWFTGSNWAGGVSPGLGSSDPANPDTVIINQGATLISGAYADTPSNPSLDNLTIDLGRSTTTTGVPRFAIGNGTLGSNVTLDSTGNAGYREIFRAYGTVNFAGTVLAESSGGQFTINVQNYRPSSGGSTPGVLNTSGQIVSTNADTLNINGAINNTGTILANGGAIQFTAPNGATVTSLSGSGSITIENGGAVGFVPYVHIADGVTITFGSGDNNTLSLDANDMLGGRLDVAGFDQNDAIDLTSFADGATSSYADGILTVTDGVNSMALDFGASAFAPTVMQGADGTVSVAAACFLAGTRVLTDHGERPIEEIAIGDRLIAADGAARPVKWVGRRVYSAEMLQDAPDILAPVLIRAGALGDGLPKRDLHVSPCHAMYLDGILIRAADLVNGVSVLRRAAQDVQYINLEFERHEVIIAEGSATESFCCNGGNRRSYDNWREYAALYPQDDPFQVMAGYAPRLDCGFAVEAVRRRINALAGIEHAPHEPGHLQGWLQQADARTVRGWAADEANPHEPVVLELLVDDESLGEVIANHYRAGQEAAGHPTGRCGFQVELPAELPPERRHVIRVRRVADGAELHGSPCLLEASPPLERLASVLGRADATERERAIVALASQMQRLLEAQADLSAEPVPDGAPGMRLGKSALRPAA